MRSKEHRYEITTTWTGNTGTGTADYRSYRRDHDLSAPGKPVLAGSSDPVFRGDPARYNPEDLLVASLSACHMLAYLHLCATNHIVVEGYVDTAEGFMQETPDGGGAFTRVLLRPHVEIAADSDPALAQSLHHKAHELCFIANSVRFPVECEAETAVLASEVQTIA